MKRFLTIFELCKTRNFVREHPRKFQSKLRIFSVGIPKFYNGRTVQEGRGGQLRV